MCWNGALLLITAPVSIQNGYCYQKQKLKFVSVKSNLVVHLSFESSSNQSDISTHSDGQFLNLVVDFDSEWFNSCHYISYYVFRCLLMLVSTKLSILQISQEVQRRKTLGQAFLDRRSLIQQKYVPKHAEIYVLKVKFVPQDYTAVKFVSGNYKGKCWKISYMTCHMVFLYRLVKIKLQ